MKPEPVVGKFADFVIGVALAAIFLPVSYGLIAAGLVSRIDDVYSVILGMIFPWNNLMTLLTVELIYFGLLYVSLRRVKLMRRGALTGGVAILLCVAAFLLLIAGYGKSLLKV